MKILKFWNPEGLEDVNVPNNNNIIFKLSYNNLEVGTLELNSGEWTFYYSENFKQNEDLFPIVDFPDKNKKYKSKDLWPYFMTRIPSLKQPNIIELIRKKKIDSNNLVDLLKNFGQKTITSPFELQTA